MEGKGNEAAQVKGISPDRKQETGNSPGDGNKAGQSSRNRLLATGERVCECIGADSTKNIQEGSDLSSSPAEAPPLTSGCSLSQVTRK